MTDSEIENIINSFMERDICNEYYRLTYRKPIYIGPVKVKSLKERLEEATMHADCEFCIKRDICTRDVPKPCKYRYTEEERIADQAADRVGVILNATYLPKTYEKKTYEQEEQKMKATSTETFHDVIAIDFELQTFPNPDENDKFIVTATNRDDIFCFVFEGPYIADACRKAGLFTSWEKDQKIREKNREINKLNKQLHEAIHDKKRFEYKLEEKDEMIKDLQSKYNLEKAANEAQHKFFRQYAGKGTEIEFNYAIGDTDEVSYVIVDKERYQTLKDNGCNVTIHGKDYTPMQLVDRIFELERLKTPTIENFADEEPSSRRDILRCAEKCVCGKREQDYGTPESNFQLIADLWNQYLFKEPGAKEVFGIGPMDVAMMMALMKIARIRNGGGSGDSFVDLAGYAACGGEIWHSNKETNTDSN